MVGSIALDKIGILCNLRHKTYAFQLFITIFFSSQSNFLLFVFVFFIQVKNRIKYRNKCVLYVQKIVRGFLARKQHQPRYRGIIKIKSLKEKLRRSTDIVTQLKGGKDMILKQANDVEFLIDGYVKKIQNESHIKPKTIDQMYTDIMTKIDNYNNSLQNELKVGILIGRL